MAYITRTCEAILLRYPSEYTPYKGYIGRVTKRTFFFNIYHALITI